jgi:UDP-N-acetylmuramoyl-L-alanyl-D-glutamate--2,6-diaminopimelate ligase
MPTIMTINKLIKDLEYKDILFPINQDISSIEYDSRKCQRDSLFVAIRGGLSDGHNFIESAISLGACVVVCEEFPQEIIKKSNKNITYILVENTRKSLAILSHAFFDFPCQEMKIFGITGTNGKTTTTHLLKQILEFGGNKTGLIGTNGIWIGQEKIPATHTTPESLEIAKICSEMRKCGVSHLVMEVSSHSLEQFRIFGINFDVTGFLNLSHDHLDYHGSMGEYAKSKKILFDNLKVGSISIANADDKYSEFILSETKAKKITFSMKAKSEDYNIHILLNNFRQTHFTIDRDLHIISPLIGLFNVQNLAMAILLARHSGLEDEIIMKSMGIISPPDGRMQRVSLENGVIAVIDYAHTPDALGNVLSTLRELLAEDKVDQGRLICVFGCGGDRDKTKRSQMGAIATRFSDFVVITSDNPRTEDPGEIISDVGSGTVSENYEIISDRKDAIKKAISESISGDIVLIAGKGHEDYQIIGTEKIHFSDYEEVGKYV